MSLPSYTSLKGLDYVMDGMPFFKTSGKSTPDTFLLDTTEDGMPFVGNPGVAFIVSVSIEELINSIDEFSLIPLNIEELADSYDSTTLTIRLAIEELINGIDETLLGVVKIEELANSLDQTKVTVRLSIEELINSTDNTIPGVLEDYMSGIKIIVADSEDNRYGIKTIIAEYSEAEAANLAGIKISILEDNLVPVTNLFSLSNTFQPTAYVGGVPIVTNPSTDPGGTAIAKTEVYLHWLSTGIDGNDWTDLSNFNFELDYYGGNFSFDSKRPPKIADVNYSVPLIYPYANYFNPFQVPVYGSSFRGSPVDQVAQAHLGKQSTVFGFNGTIVDFGAGIADSQTGYSTQGIFGNPLMHRQLNLLLKGNTMGFMLQSNERLAISSSSPYGDAASLAKAITRLSGADIMWAVRDVPLKNAFKLDGMTGLQAVGSLAALAGATLRWNGNNKYVVAYPDQSFGLFEIPNPKLLTTAGIKYSQHLDLETGTTGTGLLIFPSAAIIEQGEVNLPDTGKQEGALPALTRLGSQMRQRMNEEDPPVVIDLPMNYDRIFIQILVASSGNAGGNNLISINNFITRDVTQWFEFDTSLLTGDVGNNTAYIFKTFLGNTFIPQMKIDYKVFTALGSNTSIDDGHFVLSLACSTKDNSSLFNDAQKQNKNDIKETIAGALDPLRYIKTYSGTITCQFYGTIPIPGMWGRAVIPAGATIYSYDTSGTKVDYIPVREVSITPEDFIVEGVIENVQFSYPGTITINVAQYAKINYLEGRVININTTTVSTGGYS